MFKKITINTDIMMRLLTSVASLLGRLAIAVLVITAIYVSFARHFIPLLAPNYKTDIENKLSLVLKAPVHINSISGGVVGFNPELQLNDIRVDSKTHADRISIELALASSLLARQPRFASVKFKGIKATLTQVEGGWQLGDVFFENNAHQDLSWIAMLSKIRIAESDFDIVLKNKKIFSIDKIALVLNQIGSRQHIVGDIKMPNKKSATVIADGKGDWSDVGDMQWDLYTQLPETDWRPWLKEKTGDFIVIKNVMGSGQLWAQWREGKIDDVRLRLELPSFAWKYTNSDVSESLQGVHLDAVFQKRDNKTILSVPTLSFMRNGQAGQLGGWSLNKTQLEDNRAVILLEAGEVALDSFVQMTIESHLLPANSQGVLAGLLPRGKFQNAKGAIFFNENQEFVDFTIAGTLSDVLLNAWRGSPKVSGVTGNILFNRKGGHFALNSNKFTMEFPDLFTQGWQYQLAKGDLYWVYDDQQFIIRSGLLNVSNDVASVFGQFDYTSPHDATQSDHLGLALGFRNIDANKRMQYIPTKVMSKSLSEWLENSIVKGKVVQGAYLYDGGVSQHVKGDITQQVALDVEAVDLKFDPEWPVLENVSGPMIYNNDGLHVQTQTAQLLSANIKDIDVQLPAAENNLHITGQATASASTVMDLLRTTPLHAEIGSALDSWQVDGMVEAGLQLGIPLDHKTAQVDVRGMLKNTNLKMPDMNLDITKINGDLNYSTTLGLNSQQLTATAFNMPVTVSIATSAKDPTLTARLKTQGKIAIDTLAAWQPSQLWSYVKGALPYNLELQIPLRNSAAHKPVALVINSALQGVSISLPPPFGKTANSARPFGGTITFNDDHYRVDTNLRNEDVRALFKITKNKEPLQAHIQLGSVNSISDPTAPGLLLTGNTPSVIMEDWLTFLETEKKVSHQIDPNVLDINIDIQTGMLQAFDQKVENAKLTVDRSQQAWKIGVDSQIVSGTLMLPDNQAAPYDVNLKHVRLPAEKNITATATKTDPLASINPNKLPAMQVRIDDFNIGDEKYGKWYFTLSPIKNGVDIKNVQIDNMKYFSIIGKQGSWTQDKKQSQTYFKGRADATDLGTALKAWGYITSIESEKAQFDADMTWPGSPAMFSVVNGNGNIKFKLEKGRITDTGNTGALKLFGLMNLSALTRRLAFDFTDLYKSGISYDKAEANIQLQNGIATFNKPMTINGPSSDFEITGMTNFKTGEVNQEVVVTPPVGQNATLIATALCGPACGGVTYLIQKIGNSGIKKFSSVKYKMTGSFDNPVMERETIFDEIKTTPSPSPDKASDKKSDSKENK